MIRFLLGAIEQLVAAEPELMPQVSDIFKSLYDQDLVEENVFRDYLKTDSEKFVTIEQNREIRFEAELFIHWLMECDEVIEDI